MNNLKLEILLFIFVFLFSCNKESKIVDPETRGRKVTCTKPGDYDYLDNYKIDSLCTDAVSLNYQSIWKELFLEKNNLADTFFNNHVELCQSKISISNDGEIFSICYKYKIDWAIAYNCDKFIIKINKDNKLFPSLNLPRDTYLSKEQINSALDMNAFYSIMQLISNAEPLKFNSIDNALVVLSEKSDVNKLCLNRIFINRLNGNLTLDASAKFDTAVNMCIFGEIDLITGETSISETPCFID